MMPFAPLFPKPIEGLRKDFLSFLVPQGFEAHGSHLRGKKGIKGRKYLSHLFYLFSCRVTDVGECHEMSVTPEPGDLDEPDEPDEWEGGDEMSDIIERARGSSLDSASKGNSHLDISLVTMVF